ncbi:MAG: PA2778 family cysteine peptidase, partial [Algiphilus sp.]
MNSGALRLAVMMAAAAANGGALHASSPVAESRTPVELVATPFFAQRVDHCGPAALATVLVESGR